MKIQSTRCFEKINNAFLKKSNRIVVAVGGSRSGKSYSMLQIILLQLMSRRNIRITVWRNEAVTCRATIMVDFQNILLSDNLLYNAFSENKALGTFTCKKTGSKVSFSGTDSISKVLGMTQDISMFNEISEFSQEVYLQITQRTGEKILCDYNPSKSFFLDKYRNRLDTEFVHSTYKDNAFVPKEIVKQLESYNPNIKENIVNGTANNYLYQVYCLGLKSEKPNKIYNGWKQCTEEYFDKLDFTSYYGHDFGEVSPTANVEVKYDGDRTFYIRERLYKPENVMYSLSNELEKIGIGKDEIIVADSASRDKILELRKAGYYVIGARKGNNSNVSGISLVSKFNIVYTSDSVNIEAEYDNYSWELDRYGIPTDIPLKKDDHLMDALKYVIVFLYNYLTIPI